MFDCEGDVRTTVPLWRILVGYFQRAFDNVHKKPITFDNIYNFIKLFYYVTS